MNRPDLDAISDEARAFQREFATFANEVYRIVIEWTRRRRSTEGAA
jgi:hypothetical protein